MKRTWILAVALLVVAAMSGALADPYQDLVKYKMGDSRAALVQIENEMRAAAVAGYPAIEDKLLAVLQSAEATEDAKSFVCRCLRQIGSAKCVSAVAPLLSDERLSHMARYALQNNSSPAAGKALRNALGTVKGKLLIGVISSVGARRDAEAVGTLASLAKDPDAAVAAAAMNALGHIGGAPAARALEGITPSATLQKAWVTAYLECAETLPPAEAEKIYRHVLKGSYDSTSRVAALAGLVRAGQMTPDELMAMLKGDDPKLQVEAAQLVAEVKDARTVQAYLAALPSLPANIQVIVISGLAASANKAAAAAVASLVGNDNAEVSTAALKALGVIGSVANVPMLMQLALGKDEKAALAFASLTRLPGAEVDAALEKFLKSQNAAERAKAIEAFAARVDRRQNQAILAACGDNEKEVRLAAYKALRLLAEEGMIPALADLLVAASSSSERGELEQTVTAVALRTASPDTVAAMLTSKLGKSVEADASLLTVLAKRGGARALEAVRKCAASDNVDLKKAAVRAMSAWTDTTPLNDLMAVAQNDTDASCRIMALRGCVRLIGDSNATAGEKVKQLKAVLDTAKQPEAQKQVLSGLANVKDMAALKLAATYLDDAAVANEAAASVLSISQELVNKKKSKDKAIVEALTRIHESNMVNESLRKQAGELLKKLAR